MAVSLWGVGAIAAGALLVWTAVYDPQGGPAGALRDLLTGRMPAPGEQKTTTVGRAVGRVQGGTSTGVGRLESAQGSAQGAAIVAAAKTYIGVPYRWAGASRSGVDCSGLVMLAAKAGAGISLPHLADAQMRKGRIIPASAVRPGDLVGWPSPAHYTHIGIMVSPSQTIEAQTTGTRVGIFPLGRRAGGNPTFVRITKD